jgi:hypothetical protein
MPETVMWSFAVEASQGPRLAGSDSLSVGAYDKLSVVIEPGATDVDVDVQPAGTAGKVKALVIQAGVYDKDLTFSADGGATKFPLDGPVVLIGTGAVLLLSAAPKTLRFANATAADATIDVFVGRDPTA